MSAATYADIDAVATTPRGESFPVTLQRIDGVRIAQGRDFGADGQLDGKVRLVSADEATALVDAMTSGSAVGEVVSIDRKPYTRRPAAPFTTSTLQQEAGRKLRYSAQQTMSVAQGLYENGYITYMRTDSVTLSSQAVNAARAQAKDLFGAQSVPDSPRLYQGKSKNAQEAHEAIRPAGDTFPTPASLKNILRSDEWKLYELIWKRTVASQMVDAKGHTVTITLGVDDVPPW